MPSALTQAPTQLHRVSSMSNPLNLLLIMADQLSPFALPCHGNPTTQSPAIDSLAATGVVFDAAYCNSPLCGPARMAFMTGQLPARIGAYDNAAYFPANTPTFAHVLRHAGYQTCLAGKMHFVGPDQHHGFEERLTTDIYPADFGWVPDWEHPDERIDWWYHNLDSVCQAGIAEITNQLEFDDETGAAALAKLHDLARGKDPRPFALCVSFTHPHDPYAARREYWDRYAGVDIDMPRVAPIDYPHLDPHSQRLWRLCDIDRYRPDTQATRNARRAYYANISYLDDWIGRMLGVLNRTGLREDTVVILTSDHGDMLGERGLWYKMSFFEGAARVPLIINVPGRFQSARVARPVSHVDLLPTLMDLFSASPSIPAAGLSSLDGVSLRPLIENSAHNKPRQVHGEYLGEGAISPLIMLRRDRYKFIHCPADPPQLFDLETDPEERHNLSMHNDHAPRVQAFLTEITERLDLAALDARVRKDQNLRRFLYESLSKGEHTPWDYQPRVRADQRYMRNHLNLNDLERTSRYPRPGTKPA